ncbi:MAG: glycosyltransferase, partial [Kiritimatiellae bacterium]|nr:glycosyltransferase [Kiritimatiellia bacterium]
MSGTAAVIVSWNGLPWLQRHASGWQAQREAFARIIVVDNHSTDGTKDWLEAHSAVESVRLPRNLGFAAGANAGIRAALMNDAVDAVALINNDVLLDPDWNRAARAALFSAD